MKRIAFALALGLCAAGPAFAQTTPPLPLVGVLRINTVATNEPFAEMLRQALVAVGDVDGRNLRLDFRLADGDATRFPELAVALVQDKPTVIVAFGPAAVRAAQRATRAIPIVAAASDLIAFGSIASLAKPGGNITGVSLMITELDAKRLEVLKEIVPSGRRFGLLIDPAISGPDGLQAIADTARALGVEFQTVEVRSPTDFAPALEALRAGGAEGVNVLGSPLLFGLREELGSLLLKEKLPAVCEWREMAVSGCLASYGTTVHELYGMVAALIDKILKGASPADTPAQQPTRFELVINQKVARAIGIEIPQAILGRADEIIE